MASGMPERKHVFGPASLAPTADQVGLKSKCLPCPSIPLTATAAAQVQHDLLGKHTARNATSHAQLNEVQVELWFMTRASIQQAMQQPMQRLNMLASVTTLMASGMPERKHVFGPASLAPTADQVGLKSKCLPCPSIPLTATAAAQVQHDLLGKHTARNATSHAQLNEVQVELWFMTPDMPNRQTPVNSLTMHQHAGNAP